MDATVIWGIHRMKPDRDAASASFPRGRWKSTNSLISELRSCLVGHFLRYSDGILICYKHLFGAHSTLIQPLSYRKQITQSSSTPSPISSTPETGSGAVDDGQTSPGTCLLPSLPPRAMLWLEGANTPPFYKNSFINKAEHYYSALSALASPQLAPSPSLTHSRSLSQTDRRRWQSNCRAPTENRVTAGRAPPPSSLSPPLSIIFLHRPVDRITDQICDEKGEPFRSCLAGFSPASVEVNELGDHMQGCRRSAALRCDIKGTNVA
jgi:hypothetical protein